MLLTGSFSRALDEKLRLAIPKRLRDALQCHAGGILYVAPGTDRSLAIYSAASFSQLAEKLAQASPVREDVRAFLRLFYAQAQQVELDSQGRVRLPSELAVLAGLEKEVVLLGVQEHLEVWAAERWKMYLDQKQPHYDEIAEKAFCVEK
ncbi:MAG: division/cell wall cluster transcriptional repressor MraZ [Pirellulales bacterium]|nr:division/cell wall cluster transcriptional repressor MraZ [Pirellulales bacterium]